MYHLFKFLIVVALAIPTQALGQSCVDLDGDGYGMNGDRPCRTRRIKQPPTSDPASLAIAERNMMQLSNTYAEIEVVFNAPVKARLKFGTDANQLNLSGPYNGFYYRETSSQRLTGLTPDTKYYYQITANSRDKRQFSSQIFEFTTTGTATTTTVSTTTTSTTTPPTTSTTTTSTTTTSTTSSTTSSTTTTIQTSSCDDQKQNLTLGEARGLANFHTMSLYWSPSEGRSNRAVQVKYKPCGTANWLNGLDIIHHPVDTDLTNQYNPLRPDLETYRGSIVHLEPDTEYIVELSVEGTNKVTHIVERTRSENFQIGRVIDHTSQTLNTLRLNSSHSGSPNNYTLIDGTNATINAQSNQYGIEIDNLSYAIIRGFRIINARRSGIYIDRGDSLIIENNEISNWGTKEQYTDYAVDGHDAIATSHDNDGVKHLVIQRNKIFNPAYTSNTWSQLNTRFIEARRSDPSLQPESKDYHPQGSAALTLNQNYTGNHIIRYNEIGPNPNGNYFKDGIGGAPDGSYYGNPGPDSDLYGNYVGMVWDDAIEIEGGGLNVRVFENYINRSFAAISNAPTSVGPMYIFRNTTGVSESHINNNGGFGYFLKMGYAGGPEYMGGYVHIYNNSILSLSDDGYGGIGTTTRSRQRLMANVISRNNIFYMRNATPMSFSTNDLDGIPTSSTDYSLSNRLNTVGNNEQNGIDGIPRLNGNPPLLNTNTMIGDFSHQSNSPALDNGLIINNFADQFTGSGPDIGSHENGSPNKTFGVNSNAK